MYVAALIVEMAWGERVRSRVNTDVCIITKGHQNIIFEAIGLRASGVSNEELATLCVLMKINDKCK